MPTIGVAALALLGASLLLFVPRRPGSPRRPQGRPADGRAGASGRARAPSRAASVVRRILAGRRLRQMEADVPEALDVLRATIAAGVAPRRALQAAAESAPPSLAEALGEAVGACELGAGAGDALAQVGRSHGLTELLVAGEALDLSEATGAPPGRVLAGVAVAAADRLRSDQARMAAQARLSARVVAGMAPVFVGVLALTAPSDAAFLIRGRAGWLTLAGAALLEGIGILWAGRIVRGAR
jgi:tight adherence protein B